MPFLLPLFLPTPKTLTQVYALNPKPSPALDDLSYGVRSATSYGITAAGIINGPFVNELDISVLSGTPAVTLFNLQSDNLDYFSPTVLNMTLDTVSGLVTAPTFSMGTNDPDYDNIYPQTKWFDDSAVSGNYQNITFSNGQAIALSGGGSTLKAKFSSIGSSSILVIAFRLDGKLT